MFLYWLRCFSVVTDRSEWKTFHIYTEKYCSSVKIFFKTQSLTQSFGCSKHYVSSSDGRLSLASSECQFGFPGWCHRGIAIFTDTVLSQADRQKSEGPSPCFPIQQCRGLGPTLQGSHRNEMHLSLAAVQRWWRVPSASQEYQSPRSAGLELTSSCVIIPFCIKGN